MNSSVPTSFIEVDILHHDNFLKIKETLTRIGIPSHSKKTLYQSCHILHKQKKYYIVHFKEMFILDNMPSILSEEDRMRRNFIIKLLEQWGLISIVIPDKIQVLESNTKKPYIKILSFKEKSSWSLKTKYIFSKI